MRTGRSHVSKARESVIAALNVIAPGDAGHLWEALKASQSVEKALGIAEESDVDKKYLEALAETYNNASSSFTVMRIVEHTLRTLKNEHPELTTAFLRQDNAGCYHSAEMLASCAQMKTKTGIAVQRVDFSDPQGGKGSCDRKAATVKAHVRRYINEGHDVLNANDFMNAILSNGGIPNVRVVVVDASATERNVQVSVKWVGINSLNNFLYSDNVITVWRAFDVGEGKKATGM